MGPRGRLRFVRLPRRTAAALFLTFSVISIVAGEQERQDAALPAVADLDSPRAAVGRATVEPTVAVVVRSWHADMRRFRSMFAQTADMFVDYSRVRIIVVLDADR